eukprot:CAMPEP_0203781856 /NCGR_PEP_ID=MMETSP0099_2-20121227/10575_1 /ASSEMBLY_ACC=CAM_ASM_000209 /TAXON_ID=96639 /ORGANISM=" , Strain NY0313808BC1" /LENGTH=426 /DNA_ID=CAMNT_0050683103 /DNA_START=305 /DNA_END=1582 /DNA_ORIENTATION=+
MMQQCFEPDETGQESGVVDSSDSELEEEVHIESTFDEPSATDALAQDQASQDDESQSSNMTESVRYMFLQLLRRLNMHRSRQNDHNQVQLQKALDGADRERYRVFCDYIQNSPRITRGRQLRYSRLRGTELRWYGKVSSVFGCSACGTPICRPVDVKTNSTRNSSGPSVILADSGPKQTFDLYTQNSNVALGEGKVFTPPSTPRWSYEMKPAFCPNCKVCLGVNISSIGYYEDLPESCSDANNESRSFDMKEWQKHFVQMEPESEPSDHAEMGCVVACSLYGAPRVVPPDQAFAKTMSSAVVTHNSEPKMGFVAKANETVLCGRYLSVFDGHSSVQEGGIKFPLVLCGGSRETSSGETVECNQVLTDSHQILCTKRSWRTTFQGTVNAFYVNSLRTDSFKMSEGRVEALAQGPFFMCDVLCSACQK